MKRTMRIATSAVVTMAIVVAGLMSPVASSVPHVAASELAYDVNQFFPMAIGNSWQWADSERMGDIKRLSIVDTMDVEGYAVWVADTQECIQGVSQTPGVMYFVVHDDGLFATQFLDSLMDWSYDTDDTSVLQRWTQRGVAIGTHSFNSVGVAQAYTVGIEEGVPAMRVHDASGQTTYQRYAYGIGPVLRGGHFALQEATVGGIDYVM
jgi:hypothetical protein